MVGKTLGHYQIPTHLGHGGMGEVYKAKGQRLGRDVAIKVLPEEFARDADRVARFQREAKLLASLNHPNIAAIHGLEAGFFSSADKKLKKISGGAPAEASFFPLGTLDGQRVAFLTGSDPSNLVSAGRRPMAQKGMRSLVQCPAD
jgi:serine/threonine protein kinase